MDIFLNNRLNDLDNRLSSVVLKDVDPVDVPHRIAQVVERWVERSLSSLPNDKRHEAGIAMSSQLMASLRDIMPDAILPRDALVDPLQRLVAIESVGLDGKANTIEKPLTPIRDTVLMTNARGEPGVGRELLAEIVSADRIDLVCAFIRWTGIREMLPALRRHVESGRELRVITTTYTGTTESRALEALQNLGGQVKVSYDTSTTRLHAKAWLFHRNNGHSTVYIGSSNLTFSAQVTGLEWNVRAAQRSNPALIEKFEATFFSYWANSSFEIFDQERFRSVLNKQRHDDIDLTPFDIHPYPFQRQILEKLQVDRARGYPHNLVVAATGTGKTVMAALDYRILKDQLPRARLLYVAHRKEILQQSRATFRHVLRDGAFGEFWLAGQRPQNWGHVFASIQTLNNNENFDLLPDHFDIVVVDEFHHAAASSYKKLLNYVQPKHLLGLTATPERTDNLDILRWFGNRICVELRLWDALEQELLSPFHYFGIHDGTDLSNITWQRGKGYNVSELTNVYTADNIWASKILQAVNDKIGEPRKMRALGFCVSIEHAKFMAQEFEKVGLHSKAITSETPAQERNDALSQLRDGLIQTIF
ncbi:MAG: DEAD/DEAH box helicase family protein, partial [Candidatus Latescibacteria bacterium]|nr:DEAD/DEAH box helicase family protein [Candidatus Latescibacterota bacterium]